MWLTESIIIFPLGSYIQVIRNTPELKQKPQSRCIAKLTMKGNFSYDNSKSQTAQARYILMPLTSSHRSGKQPNILSPNGRLHPLATKSTWQKTSSCTDLEARYHHTACISTSTGDEQVNTFVCKLIAILLRYRFPGTARLDWSCQLG